MNTYQEAEEFLFERLPMFQRIGAAAYKNDLSNTYALLTELGNPEKKSKYIHIAGTNGKGSTSSMLAAILTAAGYKVGLYTSPHLKHFNERIRINGKPISEEDILSYVQSYQSLITRVQPSFFELTTAMAFEYFADKKVDIAIMEVGLGGRLDSTNVISPLVSVITQIDYDHQQFLGDTLEEITGEKAGIIKANTPVVTSINIPSLQQIIRNIAKDKKAPFIYADDRFQVNLAGPKDGNYIYEIRDVQKNQRYELLSDLGGSYQAYNLKTVLATIDVLKEYHGWEISEVALGMGIKNVSLLSGLRGRWQKFNVGTEQISLVADTGHNQSAVEHIVEMLTIENFEKLHMIWGAVNDKSIEPILGLLPKGAIYYFTQAKVPRALDSTKLATLASTFGLKGSKFDSVEEAFQAAIAKSSKNDLIFVGGSTFIVAELPILN